MSTSSISSTPPPSGRIPSTRWSEGEFRLLGAALVALLAVAAFAPALRTGFVYDDFSVVSENPDLPHLLEARKYFTTDYFRLAGEATYRPLVTLSYALDYRPWGKSPFGYHLTNLCWHVAACVAFFLSCASFGARREVALAAGLIYATHPVRSEGVVGIGFREDLLCATFYFAALALWPAGRTSPRADGGQDVALDVDIDEPPGQWRRFLGAVSLYVLALLSKEMALSFPVVVLAKELRSRKPVWKAIALRQAVAWAVTLSALALFVAFDAADVPETGSQDPPRFLARLGGFAWISLRYCGLLLVPYPLSIEHVTATKGSLFGWTVAGSVVVILLLGALAWRLRRRFPAAPESLVAFYVLLGPVSNLIPIFNPMAERYLTIPAAAFAWFIAHLLGRIARRDLRWAATALLIGAYVALSWIRIEDWRDPARLWGKAIEQGSETARTLGNLGGELVAQGRRDEALDLFRRAAQADPADYKAYNNISRVYYEKRDFVKAAEICESALRNHPNPGMEGGPGGRALATLHNNWGNALFQLGRFEEAKDRYEEAGKVFPHLRGLDNNLGNVLLKLGRTIEAIDRYKKAIEKEPDWELARRNLGFALWQMGQYDAAIEQYRVALRLKPDWNAVRAEFARLVAEANRAAEPE